MTPDTQVYQVTMTLKLERNPRKWIADSINDCLEDHEELIDYQIIEIVSELHLKNVPSFKMPMSMQ